MCVLSGTPLLTKLSVQEPFELMTEPPKYGARALKGFSIVDVESLIFYQKILRSIVHGDFVFSDTVTTAEVANITCLNGVWMTENWVIQRLYCLNPTDTVTSTTQPTTPTTSLTTSKKCKQEITPNNTTLHHFRRMSSSRAYLCWNCRPVLVRLLF